MTDLLKRLIDGHWELVQYSDVYFWASAIIAGTIVALIVAAFIALLAASLCGIYLWLTS